MALCLERRDAAKNPDQPFPTLHEALGDDANEGNKAESRQQEQEKHVEEQSQQKRHEEKTDPSQTSLDESQSKQSSNKEHPHRPKPVQKSASYRKADTTPASPTNPRAPKQSSTVTPDVARNVLLVDDNKINLQLLVTFMKKSGHNYVTANNGLEALEAYKRRHSTSPREGKDDPESDSATKTDPTSESKPDRNDENAASTTSDDKPNSSNTDDDDNTTTTSTSKSRPEAHSENGINDKSNTDQSSPNNETDNLTPPPFNIILMDLSMPIMDGLESTRHIRAFERANNLAPTTVIALTGLASASAQQEAFSSGIDTFMTKPVKLKELAKILDGTD